MLPVLIHRALIAAGLALILLASLVWPARHVLAPLWPQPVEEILYRSNDGGIDRRLQFVGSQPDSGRQPVARHRPLSLVVADTTSGSQLQGFVAGIRDGPDGELVDAFPDWLQADPPKLPAQSEQVLLIQTIDEQMREVAVVDLVRLYRPNQLTTVQRAEMTVESVIEVIGHKFRKQQPENTLSAGVSETQ